MDSEGKSTEQPSDTTPYDMPSKDTLSAANSFALGYNYSPLSQYNASFYMRPAGLVITNITDGSIADKAGLKAGDVITSFDGISTVDDPYAQDKAKAKIAGGETVEMVYNRGAKDYSVTISLDME